MFGSLGSRYSGLVRIGFQASIAADAQPYLCYDGDMGSGTDNHALNVGLRVSW